MAAATSNEWTGPSTQEMVRTRTLGKNIIEHQDGPTPVFDDDEITRLRRFINNPANAGTLLREHGMQDDEGEKPGTRARSKGSLAGYIMATHGTNASALTDDDIVALRDWFSKGNGKRSDER